MADIQGQIERVTYFDEASGFTIARIRIGGEREPVTCIGTMMRPLPGEIVTLSGEWTSHPKYGRQFRFDVCHTATPASVQGIRKYLGSGLIKGIGPVMSERIVDRFGVKTLDVIENDIERLAEIPGIGESRIADIRKAWKDQKEIRAVMIFLQGHGVGPGFAARIFKHYGNDSIGIVRENPYRLATDISGIGFLTADRIAEKLGFAPDSRQRIDAGILHVLNLLADRGHVYYPEVLLVAEARSVLDVPETLIETSLKRLAEERSIIVEGSNETAGRAVYLPLLFRAERDVAEGLALLMTTTRTSPPIDVEKALARAHNALSIRLASQQEAALRAAVTSKVLVITGGPGTGKTTIVKAILYARLTSGENILLAAPTGRAAKRLSEATGREAKTIHRLLEYNGRKGGFQKNADSPLECDMLVLDETSMIDIVLLRHVLAALPAEATLVLVGDVNQLPSVGPGVVLNDLIESGAIPVVELNEIFRQAQQSSIVVNAHRINQGLLPEGDPPAEHLSDFYFIEQDDPERVMELVLRLVQERIPDRFGFDPVRDIQVLSPMNRGVVGVSNLNIELQKTLNPREDGISRGGRNFRIGDKVMQISNNYDRDVFNGDIGRISGIDPENQELQVLFDDRTVLYDVADLDELTPAYAVTVHKSQGSEYPAVVCPVLTQHYLMLQRNLLYTAVTRGKQLVVLIGTKKALAIAVKNAGTEQRHSLLQRRLHTFLERKESGVSAGRNG